jgi:hypothetical protein
MKYFKLLLMLTFVLFNCSKGSSQLSEGGYPRSFALDNIKSSLVEVIMPSINNDSLIQNENVDNNVFRFGKAIDVDINMLNIGTLDTLPNGDKLCRLKIRSDNAYSINLIFDDFWLPDGADVFVYSVDKSDIIGAFTAKLCNNPKNKFSTDLIKGDIIVLEYYEPSGVSGGVLNIGKVVHGYKDLFNAFEIGNSEDCNIDVNCSQGENWCVQKRSVTWILVQSNEAVCSGCLMNNARQDLAPYVLTGFHCADIDNNGVLSPLEVDDMHTWLFRFKYWSPTCNQGDGVTNWFSIIGSNFRAGYNPTDMILLEMNSPPPSGSGVLYAGWDNSSVPSQSGAYIHHPAADVMKISLYSEPLIPDIQPTTGRIAWRVKLSDGIVQGGSSGSPLFNENGLVIGQHIGRDVNNLLSCNNLNAFAYAGRLNVSWTGGGTPQTRLHDWLDPDNTGVTTIGATSPDIFLINRTLYGNEKFAALEHMHIEGEVSIDDPFSGTFLSVCQPSEIPFTTEPGSQVEFKAKSISIKPGTYLKAGSNVHLIAVGSVQCEDNLVDGDFVDGFCFADITRLAGNIMVAESAETELEDVINWTTNTKEIKIFPNPTTGILRSLTKSLKTAY